MTNKEQPKQILYSPIDVDDPEFAQFAENKTEEEIEFEKFRDEMRESNEYAKITVYRQPMTGDRQPGAKKLVFLFECGIDEFSFSQICGKLRDEYGSGTYRIQARDENSKMRMNRSVTIEAPQVEKENRGDGQTPAGELIDRMAYAMNENTERTERMLSRMMPQTNPMGMLTEMATAMATIMSKFQAQQPAQKSMLDQLTEFKMLQELFAGGEKSESGNANLFSLLTETVKSFGPALGAAIMAQQESGAIPMQGPIQPLLENPQPEIPLDEQLSGMKPQIDFLVMQAKAGATAQAVADALFPGIPEPALENIEAFLQQENCLDMCVQVNAEVNNLRAWFLEWREIMLQKIDQHFSEQAPPIEDEVIGPEVLTSEPEQAQDSPAVAGDVKELDISATADSESDTSDVDGTPVRGGGDAGDS